MEHLATAIDALLRLSFSWIPLCRAARPTPHELSSLRQVTTISEDFV
jgi:hypothetical protein